MTHEKFRDLVGKLSYKPNTIIRVLECPYESDILFLSLSAKVEDVGNRGNMTTIHQRCKVRVSKMSEDYFPTFVREAFIRFETHELDEWLKLNGEFINHPHPLEPLIARCAEGEPEYENE